MNIFEVNGPDEENIYQELLKIYTIIETYINFNNPSIALQELFNRSIHRLSKMEEELTWWKLKSKEIQNLHNKILELLK